jgi:hypothetical protein
MTASPVPTFRTEITIYTTPSATSRVAEPPATFKSLPSMKVIGEDLAGLEDPGDLVLGTAAPGLA